MKAHIPWGEVRAMRFQDFDFVAVTEVQRPQVDTADVFNNAIDEKHIPLDDLETSDAPGPDRRVPDPNAFCPFNEPVGRSPVVEVGRWARPGVESATSGLDLCGM